MFNYRNAVIVNELYVEKQGSKVLKATSTSCIIEFEEHPIFTIKVGLYIGQDSSVLLKKMQTKSRDWEQNTHKNWTLCCWIPLQLSMRISVWSAQQRGKCLLMVCFNNTTALGVYCTVIHEAPAHWRRVDRDFAHVYLCAHFYNCLFISPRIWAPLLVPSGK